ncbi:MAG: GNAT family N-acetyltransferase [Solirubrobacteraceae bacterium]|nr:GNAT family N-acetyltransferase [Solirubrobacteraceae bacterium]
MSDAGPVLHAARFDDLTPRQLYAILRLRAEVFVVEQDCAYTDMDGRDAEPEAIQLWHEEDGVVVSTARLLTETVDGVVTGRIGRIATLPSARGRGLAGAMIRHGLEHFAGRPVVLGAQSQLEAYYGGFGFVRCGDPYDEDGIPHIPMRREAA